MKLDHNSVDKFHLIYGKVLKLYGWIVLKILVQPVGFQKNMDARWKVKYQLPCEAGW